MPLSMYQASIPVFVRELEILSNILKKGETFAIEKKIEPAILVNDRLAPDMYPLSKQVQIVTDVIKGAAARLGGREIPSFEDNEKTFPDLYARIAKTVEFVKSFNASQVDGTEDKKITLKLGGKEASFQGQPYLLNFVLPNVYFHMSITYAILRHNGVSLGKIDFLGSL